MTQLGVAPLGTELGPYGGPGLITVKGVLPLGMSAMVVVFDRVPLVGAAYGYKYANSPRSYTFEAIDPTTGDPPYIPEGEFVPSYRPTVVIAEIVPVDQTQVVLRLDAPMEPKVRYKLDVSVSLRGANDEVFAGPSLFDLRGLFRSMPRPPIITRDLRTTDPYSDIDERMRPGLEEGDLGGPKYNASKDFAVQSGFVSRWKRIYRRLSTRLGSFRFYPGYGMMLEVKGLATPSTLQQLANAVGEQLTAEPDVRSASATVKSSADGTVDIFVYVEDSGGNPYEEKFKVVET